MQTWAQTKKYTYKLLTYNWNSRGTCPWCSSAFSDKRDKIWKMLVGIFLNFRILWETPHLGTASCKNLSGLLLFLGCSDNFCSCLLYFVRVIRECSLDMAVMKKGRCLSYKNSRARLAFPERSSRGVRTLHFAYDERNFSQRHWEAYNRRGQCSVSDKYIPASQSCLPNLPFNLSPSQSVGSQ